MEMGRIDHGRERRSKKRKAKIMDQESKETWLLRMQKLAGFVLAHLITYFMVGTVFLQLTARLPEASRQALDFFTFYQPLTGITFFSQVIRGMVLGGICVSLQNSINKSPRPWLVVTGLVWGVGIFGSVEPLPGSFEGMLYTTTTALEHLLALFASLVQVLLMVSLLQKTKRFHKWTHKLGGQEATHRADDASVKSPSKRMRNEFFRRFTLLHVGTYFLVGMVFYQISGYEEALATMEVFSLWRSLENPLMPLVIFLGQFIRGFILAVLLFPFYDRFFQKSGGWKRLFITLWGMTFLAAVNIVPWVVQDLWLGNHPLTELLIGPPEVTVQMLLFSLIFYVWSKRHKRTISLPGFTMGREVKPFKVDSSAGK